MIKLIIKMSCIMAISMFLVILLNIFAEPHIKLDRLAEYDNWEVKDMPETIKYVNFGSSHGQRSFKYSALGKTVHDTSFNFGTSSQSLVYDYLWGSQYENHFKMKDGVAFITVSFFTFYQDELEDADFDKKNLRYYKYLDKEHIRQWNLKDAVLYGYIYDKLPVLQIADKQIGSLFYFDNDWLPESLKENMATFEKIVEPEAVPDNLSAVKSLIQLLKKHDYRVILVTTPVRYEFRTEYSKEFLEKFNQDVNDITEEMNIEYWNYEYLFDTRPELFIDTHHLSEDGANEFTIEVFERLAE